MVFYFDEMITIEMETGTSAVSVISIERKDSEIERNYSNETFYTDSSDGAQSKSKSAATSTVQKRHQLRPTLGSSNPYRRSSNRAVTFSNSGKNSMSACAQKILQARMLRVKELQNELSVTQYQLNELSTENRLLRTLQKRQDVILKRYEGSQSELPQLIHSHNEEVRALTSKLKQAKAQIRTLNERLKLRDSELTALREKYHHLVELSKDRNLREREQLQQQLEHMQDVVCEQDKKLQMLTRKVMLEGKNYKFQLASEMNRHKTAKGELSVALERIAKLENLVETRDKYIASSMPRQVSLLALHPPARFRGYQSQSKTDVQEDEEDLIEDDRVRDEDEEQQDISQSTYVDPQTNASESSRSLETGEDSKHPTTMDFQTKRFQFSNRQRKYADTVVKSSYNGSGSGNTSPLGEASDVDASSLGTDSTSSKPPAKLKALSRKTSFQDEISLLEEDMHKPKGNKMNSLKKLPITDSGKISHAPNISESRRGSLNDTGSIKKKGKELGFISTLMSEMDKETCSQRGSLKMQEKCKENYSGDSTVENSSNWEMKNSLNQDFYCNKSVEKRQKRRNSLNQGEDNQEHTIEDIFETSQNDKDMFQEYKPSMNRHRETLEDTSYTQESKTELHIEGNSQQEQPSESKENSLEGRKEKQPSALKDTCQRLNDIADSWGDLQNKVKYETNWAKSMMENEMGDINELDKLEGARKHCSKTALLEVLKAIETKPGPTNLVSVGADGEKVTTIQAEGTASNFNQTVDTLHMEKPTCEKTDEIFFKGNLNKEKSPKTGSSSAKKKVNLMQDLFGTSVNNDHLIYDPLTIVGSDKQINAEAKVSRNIIQ